MKIMKKYASQKDIGCEKLLIKIFLENLII